MTVSTVIYERTSIFSQARRAKTKFILAKYKATYGTDNLLNDKITKTSLDTSYPGNKIVIKLS